MRPKANPPIVQEKCLKSAGATVITPAALSARVRQQGRSLARHPLQRAIAHTDVYLVGRAIIDEWDIPILQALPV